MAVKREVLVASGVALVIVVVVILFVASHQANAQAGGQRALAGPSGPASSPPNTASPQGGHIQVGIGQAVIETPQSPPNVDPSTSASGSAADATGLF